MSSLAQPNLTFSPPSVAWQLDSVSMACSALPLQIAENNMTHCHYVSLHGRTDGEIRIALEELPASESYRCPLCQANWTNSRSNALLGPLGSKVSCPCISAGLCFSPFCQGSIWSRFSLGEEIRDLFISTHNFGTLPGMPLRTRLVLLSPLCEFFIGLATFDFVERHWTGAECLFLLFHARFITHAAGRSQADSLNFLACGCTS